MPLSAFGDGGLSVAGGGAPLGEVVCQVCTVGSPEYEFRVSYQSLTTELRWLVPFSRTPIAALTLVTLLRLLTAEGEINRNGPPQIVILELNMADKRVLRGSQKTIQKSRAFGH